MELKMQQYQLPDKISFNFEELKAELQEKVSHYETLVYSDDQIKEAKADKANLNKLKKALNDERIRIQKEYMKPFDEFKAQIDEIISIVDKPVLVIDKQVKAYEEEQKEKKKAAIKEYWSEQTQPSFLTFEQIFNEKWLNASVSMKSIQTEINERIEQVQNNLDTLSNLPEFGFEATEVYKTTLDMNKALNEGKRLSEIAKRKAEHEARMAAEAEARKQEETVVVGTVTPEINVNGQTVPVAEIPVEVPTKQWVRFQALMTTQDAIALRDFLNNRNIEFKSI